MKATLQIVADGRTVGRFSAEGDPDDVNEQMGAFIGAFDREKLRGKAIRLRATVDAEASEWDQATDSLG